MSAYGRQCVLHERTSQEIQSDLKMFAEVKEYLARHHAGQPAHHLAATFSQFCRELKQLVIAFWRRLGKPHHDAEDRAQDLLPRILKRIPRLSYDAPRAPLMVFLRGVVRRMLFGTPSPAECSRPVSLTDGIALTLVDRCPGPAAQYELSRVTTIMTEAISALRAQQRHDKFRAFELHVLQSQPVEAVAETLKMLPQQVSNTCYRLKQKLHVILKRHPDYPLIADLLD